MERAYSGIHDVEPMPAIRGTLLRPLLPRRHCRAPSPSQRSGGSASRPAKRFGSGGPSQRDCRACCRGGLPVLSGRPGCGLPRLLYSGLRFRSDLGLHSRGGLRAPSSPAGTARDRHTAAPPRRHQLPRPTLQLLSSRRGSRNERVGALSVFKGRRDLPFHRRPLSSRYRRSGCRT